MLQRTRLGRHIYAIGGNIDAARLSGVRVGLVVVIVFVVGGLTAGLAGTIGASRVSLGAADAGTGLLFPALAAVFVGGSSIYGGEGAIWRTVVGLYIIALMNNGIQLAEPVAVVPAHNPGSDNPRSRRLRRLVASRRQAREHVTAGSARGFTLRPFAGEAGYASIVEDNARTMQ